MHGRILCFRGSLTNNQSRCRDFVDGPLAFSTEVNATAAIVAGLRKSLGFDLRVVATTVFFFRIDYNLFRLPDIC